MLHALKAWTCSLQAHAVDWGPTSSIVQQTMTTGSGRSGGRALGGGSGRGRRLPQRQPVLPAPPSLLLLLRLLLLGVVCRQVGRHQVERRSQAPAGGGVGLEVAQGRGHEDGWVPLPAGTQSSDYQTLPRTPGTSALVWPAPLSAGAIPPEISREILLGPSTPAPPARTSLRHCAALCIVAAPELWWAGPWQKSAGCPERVSPSLLPAEGDQAACKCKRGKAGKSRAATHCCANHLVRRLAACGRLSRTPNGQPGGIDGAGRARQVCVSYGSHHGWC